MKPPVDKLSSLIELCWEHGASQKQARKFCIGKGLFPSRRMVALEFTLLNITWAFEVASEIKPI